MAGFFDSLADSLENRLGDRPNETPEETAHRKLPFASYVDDTLGNIPQGIMGSAQGVYEAATHPGETAQRLGHYIANPRETASNIYQHYANRYGSIPTAVETLRSDPVGFVGDVLPFTSLPGAARSLAKSAPVSGIKSFAQRAAEREGSAGPSMRYAADRDFGPTIMEGEIISPRPQLNYRGPSEGPSLPSPGYEGPSSPPGYEGPSSPSGRDPMLSIMRTDRTSAGPSRKTRIPELRLNTEGSGVTTMPSVESEMPVSPHIPSLEDFKPKSRETLLRLREQQKSPTAFEQRYLDAPVKAGRGFPSHEIIFGTGEGMNPNVYNSLLRAKLSGNQLTPFEQNMVNNYLASFKPSPAMGIHGQNAVGEIGAPKIRDTTIPPSKFEQNWRNAQKNALDKWRAENPRGLERDFRYQPYLEEELPVVYREKPAAEMKQPGIYEVAAESPPISGSPRSPGAGTEVGRSNEGLKAALSLAAAAQDKERRLPDLDIFNRRAAEATPSQEKAPVVAETKKSEEKAEPRPASQRREAQAPSRNAKAPQRVSKAPHRAAKPHAKTSEPSRAEAGSGEKYWGDWRDTEPFASDPIRKFFEDITGQKKTASKPGRLERRPSTMDLGDLLPFSQGGVARKGYGIGGYEDRIPILSDIGNALSGMSGGENKGYQPPNASESAPAVDQSQGQPPIQPQSQMQNQSQGSSSFLPSYKGVGDFFDKWSKNPASQFLFSTGIGAMASNRKRPLEALGEGGLRGLEYMRAAQSAQAEEREREKAESERLRQQKMIEKVLGGSDRKEYSVGGYEDRIPVLSDIGDAIGGVFGGSENEYQQPDASESPSAADESQSQPQSSSSFLPSYKDTSDFFDKWSRNPLSQFLFATGIGAMASDRRNPLQALGEGGIRGLEYMRAAQSAQAEEIEKEKARAERLRQQKIIDQTLGSSGTDTGSIASSDSGEGSGTPISTASAETPETAEVAPETSEVNEGTEAPSEMMRPDAAESSAAAPPSAAERKAADPTENLYSLHRKISGVMSSVTDPQLRLALANRQKAVEFEINRIEKQKEQAAAAQRAAEDRAIRAQNQKRLEEQSSPEYKMKIKKAEELGKRLDETEASVNSGAQAAPSLIDQFEVYKNAIKNGTVITGAYGEDRLNAHKTILGLTAGLPGGKSSDLRSRLSDNIKAGALQQAFAELGGRLGSGISDADRKAIQQMGISLDRDPESNIDAIETFQNAQRRKIAAAEFMEDYKQNKSSVPGQLDAGFEAAFTKWVNGQPSIVPDRVKQIMASDEKSVGKKESGPSVVATGTVNVDGRTRKVVKYSDGTVKYAD